MSTRKALENLLTIVEIHQKSTGNNFAWAEVEYAKELLEQSEQEPVAWMYDWNIIEEEEYGETKYDCLTRADSITKSRAITNVRPLYTTPPKREPLPLTQNEAYKKGYSNAVNDLKAKIDNIFAGLGVE